ncbi:hypothetical protein VCRA217O166_90092 [Vibrio crassostreae]|nr:hypothetical protein VCRA2118O237_60128 [Vibrio crassostreae]CAK3402851.1 hypothetical protein VCRA2128O309_490032 [Vibrio crassostreae]CAK3606833.1 hypothetical protein VCRA2120E246_60127 [Vibrio crassostreae]CAK3687930.1 hypothetical protein VCRA2123O287_100029 [Vibrio crassostreae]CAK3976480.1 hypothetical protein VCRA2121O260_70129 [Vibrio crassostreae]
MCINGSIFNANQSIKYTLNLNIGRSPLGRLIPSLHSSRDNL